jgi:hypothetical protein
LKGDAGSGKHGEIPKNREKQGILTVFGRHPARTRPACLQVGPQNGDSAQGIQIGKKSAHSCASAMPPNGILIEKNQVN